MSVAVDECGEMRRCRRLAAAVEVRDGPGLSYLFSSYRRQVATALEDLAALTIVLVSLGLEQDLGSSQRRFGFGEDGSSLRSSACRTACSINLETVCIFFMDFD